MKKILLVILFSCLLPIFVSAQYIYFDSIYDCNNNKYSCALTTYETNYGYFTVGISKELYKIIYVLKTDKQGNRVEIKNFGISNCNLWPGYAGSLIKTTEGGYALGGGVTSSLNSKVFLVKFDSNGDTSWTKVYGDNVPGSFYTGRQCKQTKDKGYIIVGEKEMGANNEDILLIKTDSLGNLQWQKNYGDTRIDQGWSIAVTPDSGYLIGGFTWIWGVSRSRNALVIKTDSMGNVQWQKEFGGAFDDGPAIVNVAIDSNYLIGFGYATIQQYPSEPSDAKFNIIKLHTDGGVIWDKKYADARFCCDIMYIDVINDGNIVAVGYGNQYLNGGYGLRKGMILKTKPNGDSIWMKDYARVHNNGSLNDINHIQQTSDKGLIACGKVFGAFEPPNGTIMWLLKMDSAGCLEPGCDGSGIKEPWFSGNKNMLKVFPNPAQNKLSIAFTNTSLSIGLIEIINLHGEVLIEHATAKTQAEIDIKNLPEGVYIVRIKFAGCNLLQAKFVVVR